MELTVIESPARAQSVRRLPMLKKNEGGGLHQGIHRFLRNERNLQQGDMSWRRPGGAGSIDATWNTDRR